ncbi:hypothetical protein J3R03_006425 [Actinoplanes couchii]|nr:hypothetical protein [Actinoplanes couchii]
MFVSTIVIKNYRSCRPVSVRLRSEAIEVISASLG